jgi:hypothetical protein
MNEMRSMSTRNFSHSYILMLEERDLIPPTQCRLAVEGVPEKCLFQPYTSKYFQPYRSLP